MPTVSTTPQGDADFTVEQYCSPCWDALPDDIILQIFSFLGASSLYKVGLVCKSWWRVAYDEYLWKELFYRHWHIERNIALAPGKHSWIQEYKRLHYHIPCVESEVLKQHGDQVLHVSFSHNGKMFATSSKDGYIRVWDMVYPTSLKFKADMRKFTWKYTQYSQFNESDTLLLVSGVHFGSLSTSGEIAVFSLEGEFVMQSRVMNKPYDVFGTWYNDCYLLSGNLHWTGHLNSCSALWLNKKNKFCSNGIVCLMEAIRGFVEQCSTVRFGEAYQETSSEEESVVMRLFRFANTNASSIRTILVSNCLTDEEAGTVTDTDMSCSHESMDVQNAHQQTGQQQPPASGTEQATAADGRESRKPMKRVQSVRVYENGCFCTKLLELDEEETGDRLNGTIEYSDAYRQAETSVSTSGSVGKKASEMSDAGVDMEVESRESVESNTSEVNRKKTEEFSESPRNNSVQFGSENIRSNLTGVVDSEVAGLRENTNTGTIVTEGMDEIYRNQQVILPTVASSDQMDTATIESSELSLDRTGSNTFCCVDYKKEKRVASITIGMRDKTKPSQSAHNVNVFRAGQQEQVLGGERGTVEPEQLASTSHSSSSVSGTTTSPSSSEIPNRQSGSATPPTIICDKYLIFSKGSETYTPHQIGIKRIKPLKAFSTDGKRLLPNVTENVHGMDQGGEYDEVDHLIDMHGHIIGMALSPDHRYLYVNSRPWPKDYHIENALYPPPIAQEIDIHVIDLLKIKEVGTMHRSHKAYTSNDECFFIFLDVCEEYVASGAEDKHGYLWDRHYGLCLKKYPHSDVVNSVAFNPQDPEVLVTVSDDFSIKVWRSLSREQEVICAYNKEHCIRMEHVRAIMHEELEDSDTANTSKK